jgi:hypothetical protein
VTGGEAEVQALRTRVAQLESELADQARRTNALLADAQERTYWLDRWQLDLNALMRRPGFDATRRALRGGRGVYRRARRAARAARGG